MAEYLKLNKQTESLIRAAVNAAKEKDHTVRFEVYDGWQREDGLGGREFEINPDSTEWNEYFSEDNYLSTPEYDRYGCSDLCIVTNKDIYYIWYQDNEENRVYVECANRYLKEQGEYTHILPVNNQLNELIDELYEKLLSEYMEYIDGLKQLPPEEIIRNSYEKVFKEDIVSVFEDININDTTNIEYGEISLEHVKALLSKEKSLEFLYNDWLDRDESYMDRLRASIEFSIKGLTPKDKSLDAMINNVINNYKENSAEQKLDKEKDIKWERG